jgi:hypothetical protein
MRQVFPDLRGKRSEGREITDPQNLQKYLFSPKLYRISKKYAVLSALQPAVGFTNWLWEVAYIFRIGVKCRVMKI